MGEKEMTQVVPSPSPELPFASTETRPLSNLQQLCRIPTLIWAFTESNFPTFVLPNTAFGILSALASVQLTEGAQPQAIHILQRLPLVLAFNWYNVLVFDLANQRVPHSIEEDRINKPWRPIPSGKVTAEQMRRAMLVEIPLGLALNYALNVWREGVFIHIISYLYNNLRGGDELIRDPLIAIAYGLFNSASLHLAVGSGAAISIDGYVWIATISSVILTTMHVQDLKDQAGDEQRGRKSLPLWLGDGVSRAVLTVFIPLWSIVCAYVWAPRLWVYVLPPMVVGALVVFNVLIRRDPKQDKKTWRLWCLWTATLYYLPLTSGF